MYIKLLLKVWKNKQTDIIDFRGLTGNATDNHHHHKKQTSTIKNPNANHKEFFIY